MIIDEALRLVSETEKSIQKMASSRMKMGEYDEAMKLASLARSLSVIVSEETVPVSRVKKASKPARGRRVRKVGYPRYERDDTNLIKVGWRSTREIAYKEKAPKELLDKVADKCLKAASQGEPFSTGGDFLKIKDKRGKLYSRNKVNVCLSWLRKEGLLKTTGYGPNSRNTVPNPSGFKNAVEQRWQALPKR